MKKPLSARAFCVIFGSVGGGCCFCVHLLFTVLSVLSGAGSAYLAFFALVPILFVLFSFFSGFFLWRRTRSLPAAALTPVCALLIGLFSSLVLDLCRRGSAAFAFSEILPDLILLVLCPFVAFCGGRFARFLSRRKNRKN